MVMGREGSQRGQTLRQYKRPYFCLSELRMVQVVTFREAFATQRCAKIQNDGGRGLH